MSKLRKRLSLYVLPPLRGVAGAVAGQGVVVGRLLQTLLQLGLRVDDVHVEGGARHVDVRPLDVHDVQAALDGVVATQNGAVLLAVAVHLNLERAWGEERRKERNVLFSDALNTFLYGI